MWNAYNRVDITSTSGLAGTWTYASTTVREVAGSQAAKCFFVSGMAEDGITASYFIKV